MSKDKKSARKRLSILVFVVFGLFFSLVGSAYYGLQHLSIMGGGSSGAWSYNFGESYSWEPGYPELKSGFRGHFPETRCGALHVDIFEWKTRKPTESNLFVYSERCGNLMSLSEFIQRYTSGVVVGELLMRDEKKSEKENIQIFNELKNEGLLEDVRYKEVIMYEWDSIRGSVLWGVIFPVLGAGAVIVLMRIFWFWEDRSSTQKK